MELLLSTLLCAAAFAQESPQAIAIDPAQSFLIAGTGFAVPGAAAPQAAWPAARPDRASFGLGVTRQAPVEAPKAPEAPRLAPVLWHHHVTEVPDVEEPEEPEEGGEPEIVEQARKFMKNPPVNPNTQSRDWDGYCLAFVNITIRAVRGRNDPHTARTSAKLAYAAMKDADRIETDLKHIPAGAAVFWGYLGRSGHAAIATGRTARDGSPMIISTTSTVIRELSIKQLGYGNPSGWGRI